MSVQSVVKLVNITTENAKRRDSGLSRVLGSMTKLFSKNLHRSQDLLFLKSLVGSNACIQHEKALLEEENDKPPDMPVTHDSMRLIEQAKTICEQRIYLDEAKELYSLISSKWLHAVLEIHDELAAQIQNSTEVVEYIDGVSTIAEDDDENSTLTSIAEERTPDETEGDKKDGDEQEVQIDTFRVIGIRRSPGECLGLTVRLEGHKVMVARILIDSIIDRQGLLKTGDVILQANGKNIKDPEQLQTAIEESGAFVVFKILPSNIDQQEEENSKPKAGKAAKFFVRAMFDYDPANDNLLPCQDIGLSFFKGDILEIVNWSDLSWWQARKVNSKERPGLVPSQDLEERRKCFVKHNGFNRQISCCGTMGRKEKSKCGYVVRKNLDFDKAEILLYEPLEKMPPFSRKTLVFVSPPGIPKQPLVHKLVDSNNDMFARPIPLTSRPMGEYEVDGQSCWFVEQERMTKGVEENEFLDVGSEQETYLYGTTFTSVRDVMSENKLCVIDCRPEALKLLHNSHEFLPFVIYLKPPPLEPDPDAIIGAEQNGHETGSNKGSKNGSANGSTNGSSKELTMLPTVQLDSRTRKLYEDSAVIQSEFEKYFDMEVIYEDLEPALVKVKEALKKLTSETQWVPRNWVYS